MNPRYCFACGQSCELYVENNSKYYVSYIDSGGEFVHKEICKSCLIKGMKESKDEEE